MLNFTNDYSEGAHEKVLQKIIKANREGLSGYGSDPYSDSAKRKIRNVFRCPEAQVFFLTGGTQTNQAVIASLLRRHEGVIAAETGHINTHEAGAVEYTGHKILSLPATEGKLSADTLETFLCNFYADENRDHTVFPGMVYLSYPTEYGTLYSKEELKKISDICKNFRLPLYLDGARLGYGLSCSKSDITPSDLAELCDVFYIGGTKVGALFGEAVVFTKNNTPPHFITLIKQHGALLAKGWLLGIQFDALFTDNLYFEIGKHAVEMADRLRDAFRQKNYTFFIDSPTNQIFIALDNREMERLREKVSFSFWEKLDDSHTVVRFATSWATEEEAVKALIDAL